jgi:C1A family cysteine protease
MRLARSYIRHGLVAGLFLAVAETSLFSKEKGRDIIPIEDGDTIEVMRAKIAHNGWKFTVDHNWHFDWWSGMDPEMKKEYFTRRAPSISPSVSEDIGPLEKHLGRALPSSFDLRNHNGHSYIGPIKNQASCNNCWLFGSIAAAEGSYNWTMGLCDEKRAVFSESFVLWCLGKYGGFGYFWVDCAGGSAGSLQEMEALTKQGVCSEADFPFTEMDPGSCSEEHWSAPRVVFRSWHRIPCNDIEAIKTAIYTYGAVNSSNIHDGGFTAYSGGIFEDTYTTCPGDIENPSDPPPGPCWASSTNHTESLVGWNDNGDAENNGYWILRNEWGTTWGEGGYMRVKYRSAHIACSTAYIVYEPPTPTITPTGTPAPTATPTPIPPLLGEPSSANPSVGDPFTFGAVCRPLTDTFDAYGVVADPRGNLFSFDPRNPQEAISGLVPIARSVHGLVETLQETLYFAPSLPAAWRGASYTFTLCLVPAGAKPRIENAIPGYLWQVTVTVR